MHITGMHEHGLRPASLGREVDYNMLSRWLKGQQICPW